LKPKRPSKPKSKALQPAKTASSDPSRAVAGGREATFREVVGMIQDARGRALQAVNSELVELYWQVGGFISGKIETAAWGEGVVEELARFIARRHPDIKGFTRRSLFRMRQFFDTYRGEPKVAPLVRQLPWTHNLLILSKCKRPEEREFYLRLAVREKWAKRELERQLNGALFERAVLAPPKVSPLVTQLHPTAGNVFKDTYLLDFLDLPEGHSEWRPPARTRRQSEKVSHRTGAGFCLRRRAVCAASRRQGFPSRPAVLSSGVAMPRGFRIED
jgi:predicted nuclease of restriction endonuclease-like (RecB) superfamily